jgi:hypothetical protein
MDPDVQNMEHIIILIQYSTCRNYLKYNKHDNMHSMNKVQVTRPLYSIMRMAQELQNAFTLELPREMHDTPRS